MTDTIVAPHDAAAPPASHDRDGFPVQRTKAQRPPLRADTLHRARLLDWLGINIHHRLVLLVAEAGYGKTTLLADFARQTRLRTLWFRVDDDDRDWVSVLHYLVAAGREVDPTFASRTAERLAELGTSGGSRDEIVRTFLSELARLADEPTVLIVDDYHVLDDSPDARSVIADLILRAPERFSIVLATRRRPSVPIARLRALGEVAELTTDDLRFTEPETEALFRDAYRQPLDADVLSDLARRTEGWAASLQLVRAAVRERSSVQIRAFVRGLTALDENLYDYLAEEVVGELDPAMQDFLMRTSILQLVDPALAEVAAGVPQADARRLIEAAERIGLLSRRGELGRHTVRYHPLVREFLEDRFRRDVGDDGVRTLHRTVARHAETTDWRLAAHHYAAAGDADDVRRVVRQSLTQLLGRGDVDVAHAYLTDSRDDGPDPVLAIVESRLDYVASRLSTAHKKAQAAYDLLQHDEGVARDAALFQLVSVEREMGPAATGIPNARLLADTATDSSLRAIGTGVLLTSEAVGSDLRDTIEHLEGMLEEQRRSELWHFVAVTLTNAAFIYRQMGMLTEARARAEEALAVFPADDRSPAIASAKAVLGWAAMSAGDVGTARILLAESIAVDHLTTRLESLAEAADTELWYGSSTRAEQLLREARRSTVFDSRRRDVLASEAELAVRRGNFGDAADLLQEAAIDDSTASPGHSGRSAFVWALIGYATDPTRAEARATSALTAARDRHLGLFATPLELLAAAAHGHPAISTAILGVAENQTGAISMVAEAVVDQLPSLDPAALNIVEAEVLLRPERWRPPLRGALSRRAPSASTAARLLDKVGEQDDVAILRSFARENRKAGIDPEIGRGLARRLAPRVVIEDLGRIRILIGDTEVTASSVRKKSLALLCYLLTRPRWSSTKEQVLEALWPDAEPEVGANSLNQTLYFLRRVFDPAYKEDVSADYVHYEQDVVWLDSELLASRSSRAARALENASRGHAAEDLERLVSEYTAQFALDFAYEDWALGFRDSLHIRFLEVVERSLAVDASAGHFDRAIWLARKALDVDPDADQLEALLVRLYRLSKAYVAAAEQYAHYTRMLKTTLGIEPPPLESV